MTVGLRHFFHQRRKELLILMIALTFWGLVFFLFIGFLTSRPSDATLVQQFNSNQEKFSQLKKMMEEDSYLEAISDHGVCRTNSPYSWKAPEDFGLGSDRYDTYLKLLKETGAFHASH